MDKKIQKKLKTWLDNDLITEDVFSSIESFESSEPQKTEKGTLSKTIILIGGLLVFSGITPLIGQIPDWAQLILLILFTFVLFYSAFYIEKKYQGNTFLFDSNETLRNFLFLLATGAFGFTFLFIFEFFNATEEISNTITSFLVFILSIYLFNKTRYLYQQFTLFVSSQVLLFNLLELLSSDTFNDLLYGASQLLIGSYFLRYTFRVFEPKWLGYLLSSISLVTGMGIIDSYLGSDELIGKMLNILLSTVLIWLSVRLTSQTILFVGSIDLLVNLSFLIYEIFPELGALLYLVIGTLFIFAGLYLNRLREDIKKI